MGGINPNNSSTKSYCFLQTFTKHLCAVQRHFMQALECIEDAVIDESQRGLFSFESIECANVAYEMARQEVEKAIGIVRQNKALIHSEGLWLPDYFDTQEPLLERLSQTFASQIANVRPINFKPVSNIPYGCQESMFHDHVNSDIRTMNIHILELLSCVWGHHKDVVQETNAKVVWSVSAA